MRLSTSCATSFPANLACTTSSRPRLTYERRQCHSKTIHYERRRFSKSCLETCPRVSFLAKRLRSEAYTFPRGCEGPRLLWPRSFATCITGAHTWSSCAIIVPWRWAWDLSASQPQLTLCRAYIYPRDRTGGRTHSSLALQFLQFLQRPKCPAILMEMMLHVRTVRWKKPASRIWHVPRRTYRHFVVP
ncbi:hypothetical protein K504DRAFT_256591 [Pleomassaria siparia CBS 279.74]|uniref:Uncharacterized protein n=1 Tax=Pleomassaria siparia CBS 279.74 TaxID=1314801 RepID=A0A6G1KBP1_9PLEO|nr:hypothetical protein K504DRAFT_256591 [Pleomassaria siparia CBS 279.74]